MKTCYILCQGLLVLGLLCITGIAAAQDDTSSGTLMADDIQPYNGPIGPDSPLYGLKLALEDMDESFTPNESERVDKQMQHARLRLSEVRRSLDLHQNESADVALNNYWIKMNLTNMTVARWAGNNTGLLHAQEMIVKHQSVLENLLLSHPNNTGLMRAYNNSVRLEERFGEKTLVKFNRTVNKYNQTVIKAIRLEQKEQDRKGWPDLNITVIQTPGQSANDQKGWDKNKGATSGGAEPTVATQTQDENEQGHGNQPGGNGGNRGNSDKGNGNPHGK